MILFIKFRVCWNQGRISKSSSEYTEISRFAVMQWYVTLLRSIGPLSNLVWLLPQLWSVVLNVVIPT